MTILRSCTVTLLAVASLAILAAPGLSATPAQAAQNPASCATPTAVIDGGFEVPALPPGGFGLFDDSQVPGWQTTASDGLFEYWGDGFNGVPAAEGNNFVELNANEVSTLYQDLPTTPGTTLQWSLQHRGRLGVDTLRVLIGDPAGPLIQSGPDLSDDNTAWGAHSALYVVPAGQTTTRFAFVSVSAAGGDPTFGNFLDAVSFGTAPCLIVDKSVQNLSNRTPAQAGDTLRYSVTASNQGGVDAQSSIATDTLPADLTYTPGSLVITTGPGAGALTDAIGDDAGEYDPATRQVTVRLGTGADALAGGSIAAGTSVTFQFDATPTTSTTTAQTIENTASASYVDPITGSALDATSQTTVTAVGGELAATGVSLSPLPMPIALLMIVLGAALVALTSRTASARHR
jgi:fimbrial isopeptide formation D2 family protein